MEKEKGFTLVEVMIIMVIFAIVVLSVLPIRLLLTKQTVVMKEKSFATQKAMQMMEELRTALYSSSQTNISVLNDYDDGASYNPILTTDKNVTNPADPLSGNIKIGGNWKYLRQISVINLPNEPLGRRVYVRVYKASASNPNQPEKALAELVSILRTVKNEYPPTQVFDVYILAMENVPGWWAAMSTMKPMFDSMIQDLQARDPGLEIRTHWIKRLSYGRDLLYVPYINESTYTMTTPMPYVYFYPGKMQNASGDFLYYDPDNFVGKINIDGTVVNSSSYNLADQYNHSVRYPDEVNMAGSGELSLRMLIEEMNSNPNKYLNALVVNLHGELIPLPPIRNYSDAAKEPVNFPKVRIVTHSSQLKYTSGDTIVLRVYPYVIDPDSFPTGTTLATCTIYFPNQNISINKIEKMVGSDTVDYSWQIASSPSDYTITNSSGTLISLFNTPLRHPKCSLSNRGLPSANRLYGLEYIPCPVEPAPADFTKDLAWNNPNDAKNTARWRITLDWPGTGMYTFETRIGNDLTTGTISNQPTNLSRSYFWVNTDPPITEQYQFMGDPRHCPYKDVKDDNRYNWYFTSIPSGAYQGFTKTVSGWDGGEGYLNIDVPRYFQIYRSALLKTNSIWTSITGFSNYYVGIGNEMGADAANGFPNGLPIHEKPWVPTGSSQAKVDEITNNSYGTGTQNSARLIAKVGGGWYSKPWIGELYPDEEYSNWVTNGNLVTGNYYRANYSGLASEFTYNPVKRTSYKGCASFINGKPSSGTGPFNHEYRDNQDANITTVGQTLSTIFNFPLLSTIKASRPFYLNYGSRFPPEWNDSNYSGQRVTTSTVNVYYDSTYYSSNYDASAQIKMETSTQAAYITMNGIDKQTNFGAAQIAKLTLVSMIRGFMDAGLTSITKGRIPQLPKVNITSPDPNGDYTNPGTISVTWDMQWTRWDGQLYTENYPNGFVDPVTVVYNVKYSNDNGNTWKFIQDNTSASPGERDTNHDLVVTNYTWIVSTFPKGTYLIRVEAYRDGRPLHYAYHQIAFYLNNY